MNCYLRLFVAESSVHGAQQDSVISIQGLKLPSINTRRRMSGWSHPEASHLYR